MRCYPESEWTLVRFTFFDPYESVKEECAFLSPSLPLVERYIQYYCRYF